MRFVAAPYYLGRPEVGIANEASMCAHDQGKYFEYRHAIYEDPTVIQSRTGLVNLASEVDGLDRDELSSCLSNGTHTEFVNTSRQAATRRGVSSTPTFFINGQRVEGNQPYETLKRLIDQQLGAAQN